MVGRKPIEKRLMNIERDISEIRNEMQEMNGTNNPITLEMNTCPNTKEALGADANEEK